MADSRYPISSWPRPPSDVTPRCVPACYALRLRPPRSNRNGSRALFVTPALVVPGSARESDSRWIISPINNLLITRTIHRRASTPTWRRYGLIEFEGHRAAQCTLTALRHIEGALATNQRDRRDRRATASSCLRLRLPPRFGNAEGSHVAKRGKGCIYRALVLYLGMKGSSAGRWGSSGVTQERAGRRRVWRGVASRGVALPRQIRLA